MQTTLLRSFAAKGSGEIKTLEVRDVIICL